MGFPTGISSREARRSRSPKPSTSSSVTRLPRPSALARRPGATSVGQRDATRPSTPDTGDALQLSVRRLGACRPSFSHGSLHRRAFNKETLCVYVRTQKNISIIIIITGGKTLALRDSTCVPSPLHSPFSLTPSLRCYSSLSRLRVSPPPPADRRRLSIRSALHRWRFSARCDEPTAIPTPAG